MLKISVFILQQLQLKQIEIIHDFTGWLQIENIPPSSISICQDSFVSLQPSLGQNVVEILPVLCRVSQTDNPFCHIIVDSIIRTINQKAFLKNRCSFIFFQCYYFSLSALSV